MKSTDWAKITPPLIFFIGTLAAILIRGKEHPEVVLNTILFAIVPMIVITVLAYWVIERKRRARSARTWQVMDKRFPDETKYLFPVFPRTRTDLDRLGLPTRSAVVAFPMIGVVFGPGVTFWEEGNIGWSLRIAYSNIEAVELADVMNGTRRFPAIRLSLIDNSGLANREGADYYVPQRGELVLSLRRRGHKRVSDSQRTELVRERNSRLVPA